MLQRFTEARSRLKSDPDTAAAAFFVVLLTSPALIEILIIKPSVTRELIVLGIAFLLWIFAAAFVARRTGLTLRKAWTFVCAGERCAGGRCACGRLWELALLTAWMAVLAINAMMDRGVNARVPLGYFAFFMAVYLIDLYFAMTGRQDRQRWILYLVFLVLAVACFRGIFVLASNPEVARDMSTGSFPEAERHYFHIMGVGSYKFFTGLACVFPMLVFYRKEASRQWLFTLALCLILLGMLFAGFTLVIVFTGLGLVALLVYSLLCMRGKELRLLSKLCAVFLVTIILFLGVGRLFDLHQSHLYLFKLSDITVTLADRLLGIQLPHYDPGPGNESILSEGSSTQRMELYALSIRTFLDHPLFGLGSRVNSGDFSEVGQHSTWLDYLAMYGVLTFGPFLGFMALMFRRLARMAASQSEKAHRIVALSIYVLYGMVNPVIASAMFPVVLLFFITGRVQLPGEVPLHG